MLLLTEHDVEALFPMDRALDCVTISLLAQHSGRGINRSRQRIFLSGVSLHYMAAGYIDEKLLGMKVYTAAGDVLRFLVLLYDGGTGELLAMIEADHLGRMRTGAASGVATRWLARKDASTVGVIGTGRQARTQLQAVAQVRDLQAAWVYGRDPVRRANFAREATEDLAIPVQPAETAESVVRRSDIVVTATTSREPVLNGEWLRPGAHINAIGANMLNRRELDDISLARCSIIAVDSLEQAQQEAGDVVQGLSAIRGGWDGVVELHGIVGAGIPGRKSEDEITVFKSSGIALWDVIAAGFTYREALLQGRGREINMWKG